MPRRRHKPFYFIGSSQHDKNLRLISIKDMQRLSPKEFEEYIAIIFDRMGYKTFVRGKTGDQGVDIEARGNGKYIVIQCKKYTNAVGSPEVRNLIGTVINEGADKGILVTTGTFTQHAIETARGNPIELAEQSDIIQWLKTYKLGPYADPKQEPPKQPTPINKTTRKFIFTFWQWIILAILSIVACLVSCEIVAVLSASVRPAQ